MAVVVRAPGSRGGSRGSRSGPGSRRPSPSRRSAADRPGVARRSWRPGARPGPCTPSSRSISAAIAAIRAAAAERTSTAGKPAPPGKPASASSSRAPSGSWAGRKSRSLRPGMPGGTMPVAGIAAPADDEADQAPPVDGPGERLADPDVVERRARRVEAVVLERQAVGPAELRPERVVVGDPGRVERRHVRRGRGRPPRTRRRGSDRRCRGRARPSGSRAGPPSSGRWPSSVDLLVGRRRRTYPPLPTKAGPGWSAAGAGVDAGGTTANVGPDDDRREVGRRAAPAGPRRRRPRPRARPSPGRSSRRGRTPARPGRRPSG